MPKIGAPRPEPVPEEESQPFFEPDPSADVDELLLWMYQHCPVWWQYGGFPFSPGFWVDINEPLQPQVHSQPSLIAALRLAVRYVFANYDALESSR